VSEWNFVGHPFNRAHSLEDSDVQDQILSILRDNVNLIKAMYHHASLYTFRNKDVQN
jgi:hypothetical protein